MTLREDSQLLCALRLAACLLFLFVAATAGCSSSEPETRGERVAARGTVLLDGEVLEAGRIKFVCDGPGGQVKAIALIRFGQYKFDKDNGPLQGVAKVEILPQDVELEEFEALRAQDPTKALDFKKVEIPKIYNVNSRLTAQVTGDPSRNVFDFDLESDE